MSIDKWITDALEYSMGTHNLDDVLSGIQGGEFQLFANDGGCAVTQIITYPRKKVIYIFLAGGELDSVIALQDEVIQFGRENNCDSMMQIGRKGWTKALKLHGWSTEAACMTRGL
jgi:hypothetical protein